MNDYVRRVSLREPDVMRRLREETAAYPNASIQTSPEQTQFLAFLASAMGARRAIELGVFTGYTTLALALQLPADGKVIACDVSEPWTAVARRYWREAGVEGKIDLRIAPALDTLDKLLKDGGTAAFDLIYIDADKPNYLAYYERALKLLRSGGIVAADNVLWKGQVWDKAVEDAETRAVRKFNETVVADARVFVTLLPIRDGLTLARKL